MLPEAVVLHIPHAATAIPDEYLLDYLVDAAFLVRENLRLTDLHTDTLYDYPGSARIVFPLSRFCVDAERFRDDAAEPMARIGMGALYTVSTDLTPLRVFKNDAQREALLQTFYDPHHAALTKAVDAALERYGECLVVDCHSYPSKRLPYEISPENSPRPEICIGTDAFHTRQDDVGALQAMLQGKGYEVAIDTPFSGALTPLKHYGKDKRVRAIMFEIRKDLYMNEATGEKRADFDRLKADIAQGIAILSQ